MQIPARKLVPRKQDASWKVMGSNSSVPKDFYWSVGSEVWIPVCFRDPGQANLTTVDSVVVEIEPNDIFVDKIDDVKPSTPTMTSSTSAGSKAAPGTVAVADGAKKSVRKILPKSLAPAESGSLVAIKSSSSSSQVT